MTTPSLTFRLGQIDDHGVRRLRLPESLRTLPRRLAAGIRRVSPERWWLLLFVSLFAAFFIALLFQPGIGRGGR